MLATYRNNTHGQLTFYWRCSNDVSDEPGGTFEATVYGVPSCVEIASPEEGKRGPHGDPTEAQLLRLQSFFGFHRCTEISHETKKSFSRATAEGMPDSLREQALPEMAAE